MDMATFSKQVIAGILALSAAFVGIWATAAPHSFYSSFPFPGRHWVSMLGPYNEHLARDVGGLYLALLVISVWAALRPLTENLRIVGLAWVAFSIPHLLFHLGHLGMYEPIDRAGNLVSLGGSLILGALLTLPTRATNA